MSLRCFLIIVLIQPCATIWWSLAMPSLRPWKLSSNSFEHETFCSSLTFLTMDQRVYCGKNPKIFAIIHRSLRLAIDECQYQFRHQRWNCSIFDSPSTMGKLVLRKTPETAFIYALASASIMHQIAKACAKGELTECGCAKTPNRVPSMNKTHEGFEWGGCSDDLAFGRDVSTTFLDAEEVQSTRRKIVRLVNLHNNEAGRQTLERNVQLTCKCHGVSGSCTLRVCWRTLPEFRLIGSELRTKYSSAIQVRYNRQSEALKSRKDPSKTFNQTDLIFIHRSPTFCEKNPQTHRYLTEGRECHLNPHQPGSCAVLCCDRGHQTIVRTIEEDCQCEFHWCCEVRCQRCVKRLEQHFCR